MSTVRSLPTRQIFAMGGGTLLPDSGNLKLERFILDCTGKSKPRVAFVGTAGGDDPSHFVRFYETYSQLGAGVTHVRFFTRTSANLRDVIFECDAVQVGGGNTRTMLAIWRHWEFDTVMREAYEHGIVISGSSAGSICWFEGGLTDSVAGPLSAMSGLGFLGGSNCPHYDSEEQRRPSYQRMIADGLLPDGIACDDGAGAHFVDGRFAQIAASRPEAGGYRVERTADGKARETVLDVHRL